MKNIHPERMNEDDVRREFLPNSIYLSASYRHSSIIVSTLMDWNASPLPSL